MSQFLVWATVAFVVIPTIGYCLEQRHRRNVARITGKPWT